MWVVLIWLAVVAQEVADPLAEARDRLARGDLAGAETVLRAGLPGVEAELRAPVHVALAEVLWRTGRSAEALAELDAALRLEPNLGAAHHVAAQLHLARGAYEEALVHARADLSEDPSCVPCTGAEQEALLALGRVDEAAERWETISRRAVAGSVRLSRARGLMRLGALDPARREVEHALAAGSRDPEAYRMLQEIRSRRQVRWMVVTAVMLAVALLAAAVWALRGSLARRT
ncbi:MAG: hypothetical protein AB2A00_12240 [Myxococcota bacterium]